MCDRDVVLFRQQDGSVAALEDACWHRLMPLSLGTLEGDTVVCGYHGLRFNGAGRCTFMPAQKTLRGWQQTEDAACRLRLCLSQRRPVHSWCVDRCISCVDLHDVVHEQQPRRMHRVLRPAGACSTRVRANMARCHECSAEYFSAAAIQPVAIGGPRS